MKLHEIQFIYKWKLNIMQAMLSNEAINMPSCKSKPHVTHSSHCYSPQSPTLGRLPKYAAFKLDAASRLSCVGAKSCTCPPQHQMQALRNFVQAFHC